MAIITGIDRHQISFSSLDNCIAADNEVRFIDAFVDKLDLKKLGVQSLTSADKKKEGRTAFSDALFLKLYLYAYLNGIRSSRKLEREACRNIELQWLLQGLCPNYHSIADFRKVNANALLSLVTAICWKNSPPGHRSTQEVLVLTKMTSYTPI